MRVNNSKIETLKGADVAAFNDQLHLTDQNLKAVTSDLVAYENQTISIFTQQHQVTLTSGTYLLNQIVANSDLSNNIKITIAENENVVLYERTSSTPNANQTIVHNVEFDLKSNANLYLLTIDQFESEQVYTNRNFELAANANAQINFVEFNKQVNYNHITANLNAENAQCDFKLITVAKEAADSIFNVRLNNNAPRTIANIWQKAVVKSKGKNQFLATGFIAPDCDDASNYQESRVLLLDEAAVGDASPILLIEHYNVVAGHAASVARVNEEELYYLMSRGIAKNEAEKLMTIAFVKPLIDLIPEPEIQTEILEKIQTLLK